MNMKKILQTKSFKFFRKIFLPLISSQKRISILSNTFVKLGAYLLGIGFVGILMEFKYSIWGSFVAIFLGIAIIYLGILITPDDEDDNKN